MGVVGNIPSKKFVKLMSVLERFGAFWSVLVDILILFCLKNVHCLPMKQQCSPVVNCWGLGAHRSIFPRETFKEMEPDTRVGVYILI